MGAPRPRGSAALGAAAAAGGAGGVKAARQGDTVCAGGKVRDEGGRQVRGKGRKRQG